MDAGLSALLDELHRHGVEHDRTKEDRLERLRNLEPDTAALLALLVRVTGAKETLELGTSNGYSTLWLADAVRSIGGHLVDQVADFRALIAAERRVSEALVPTGAGALLVTREA